jgi:hypothetical protein
MEHYECVQHKGLLPQFQILKRSCVPGAYRPPCRSDPPNATNPRSGGNTLDVVVLRDDACSPLALATVAQGHSAIATMWLARLDQRTASLPGSEAAASLSARTRGGVEALVEHTAYFAAGALP